MSSGSLSNRGGGMIFCVVALLFMTVGTWLAYSQAHALRTYLPVQATVLSRNIKTVRGSKSSTYAPQVEYRYVVAGQTYECSEVLVSKTSASHDWAQAELRKVPPGDVVTAYYSPNKPGDAFLLREVLFFPYIFILFPTIFLSVGLAVMGLGLSSGGGRTQPSWGVPIVWNVVGLLVAAHYLYTGGVMDLFPKIGLSLYGLIGGLMLYAVVYIRLESARNRSSLGGEDFKTYGA